MPTTTLSTSHAHLGQTAVQLTQQLFIGGCSRSGTTLLGSMLGVHPSLITTPESQFKIELLRQLPTLTEPLDLAKTAVLLNKHWRYKIWGPQLTPTQLADAAPEPTLAGLMQTVVGAYALQQGKTAVDGWVDHTPENISYATTLDHLFPNAKFIHIVRDGRAVAASILPLDWGPNSIIKASRWWMRMVSFGLAAETALPSDRIMRVSYEALVLSPEATLKTICTFLGIDYLPQMLEANGFNPPHYTTDQHRAVGGAPNPAIVTRWKKSLSRRQIEIFENQTRDFLPYLGYDLMYDLQAKPPSFVEVQQGKLVELWRGELLNKIKWLIRSYPLWLSSDFYTFAKLSDTNN